MTWLHDTGPVHQYHEPAIAEITTQCFSGHGCGHVHTIRLNGFVGDAHCVQQSPGFFVGHVRVYDRTVRCEHAHFSVIDRDTEATVCEISLLVTGLNHVAGKAVGVIAC
jgi:hypothetical protein